MQSAFQISKFQNPELDVVSSEIHEEKKKSPATYPSAPDECNSTVEAPATLTALNKSYDSSSAVAGPSPVDRTSCTWVAWRGDGDTSPRSPRLQALHLQFIRSVYALEHFRIHYTNACSGKGSQNAI